MVASTALDPAISVHMSTLTESPQLMLTAVGGNHRDRMVDDNRRQNGLVGAGFRLLRFRAADVYGTPDIVAMQVRHGLVAKSDP
jgi:very-short-patch-repair endonuclease